MTTLNCAAHFGFWRAIATRRTTLAGVSKALNLERGVPKSKSLKLEHVGTRAAFETRLCDLVKVREKWNKSFC